jgi:ribosomal protein L11 methyltransferase
VRRVVLRVREDAVEDVLDALLPRLPDGVHPRAAATPGAVELLAHALSGPLPAREELVALAGAGLLALDECDVPADWHARRQLDGGGGVAIGDRLWLRSPLDPPPRDGLLDVVIERGTAFGSGAHPTTRMCLALLTELEPGGAFADLGCGAGALAIAAALLGFEPVDAVDRDPPSVAAAADNARRNGVKLRATVLDLLTEPAPPARVIAANVPAHVHARIAELLPGGVEDLIASGVRPGARDRVLASYASAGLRCATVREEGGWLALALTRDGPAEPRGGRRALALTRDGQAEPRGGDARWRSPATARPSRQRSHAAAPPSTSDRSGEDRRA